ncbi:MAG TPA: hypothetical protein VKM55_17400 [Candidatus Lokiarchaeia archaeon]|nr:hypothetical protein [Candidatus Lokiarchaeia archaeon]
MTHDIDLTIQVDEHAFTSFKDACEAIGVSAIDYIEIKVAEIIKLCMDDIANAPGIDDPRCHINLGDE